MVVLKLIAKLHRNLRTRKFVWRHVYHFIYTCLFIRGQYGKDWTFANYGFSPLRPDEVTPEIDPREETDRFCIQMYHHLANAVDLKGQRVLEVGSGRGGGSSYLMRHLRPRMVVGVDFSQNAVKFSTGCHRIEDLRFLPADAESLPFRNDTFDVVVNVESSHCYPSMDAFVGEVTRVLRPGGYFLLADFRPIPVIEPLRNQLKRYGLTVLREADITPNVLRALSLDNPRKLQWIRQCSPRFLGVNVSKIVQEFWGAEGSGIFNLFRDGYVKYLSFVLQKAA